MQTTAYLLSIDIIATPDEIHHREGQETSTVGAAETYDGAPPADAALTNQLSSVWGDLLKIADLPHDDAGVMNLSGSDFTFYYNDAQPHMARAWQIVKGVQCKPHPPAVPRKQASPLQVRAWVSPGSMPYNAYPTLNARVQAGASCLASVTYFNTNRRPVSFHGYTKRSTGTVSWSWHEETKGSGGSAYVPCSLDGRQGSATVTFTVTGRIGLPGDRELG